MTCSKNTGSEESVFLCLIIINDVGEQTDNGQRTKNNFACVQIVTSFQLSDKFSTASMIKSTTAPTAWKIGPNGIISNISFWKIGPNGIISNISFS